MTTGRVLYRLAQADFLERVRRYSFLITLALTAYFCYICLPPIHSSYVTSQIAGHRGAYGSAYVGTLVAMETTLIFSLAGFYLVKNAVSRDFETRVGQILATTPVTKPLYTLGKALSNFAVLAVMTAVMAAAAGVMQLARHEDTAIHLWQLLAPFLLIVLPVMAAVAGLAVLFEVIPVLRGGAGNVIYFFLWITGLGVSVSNPLESHRWLASSDVTAFGVIIPSLRSACDAAFPGCGASQDFSLGFNFNSARAWSLTTFPWSGVHWSFEHAVGRLPWIGLAVGAPLLAAVFFHRFDPARESGKGARAVPEEVVQPEEKWARPATTHVRLAPLDSAARRFHFAPLVRAELRLALKSVGRWWYIVALILIVGGLASPLAISRFWLIGAWIWPVLIWSAMGTREAREGTEPLVFSIAHPLRRQLPACWLAGVMVAVLTGSGTGLRLLLARDSAGLAAWGVGALFIPTLSLALGVWSGSSKLFEVIYTLLWYMGPANRAAQLDYMGATGPASVSGTQVMFLVCTAILAVLALVGRRRQIRV
jgi:hypothetical protein